jgi:hypothetical protein
MNIFLLSWNPKRAAEMHCDTHVVKMILESAQLLYSAHWLLNPENVPETAYKLAHKNHPCAIWVRTSLTNYMWLASLAWWLCKEYQYRYGEDRTHRTEPHIIWLLHHPPKSIPVCAMSRPAQAMPDEYKQSDPIEAYQLFYLESKHRKRRIVKYTRREWPDFLTA